MDNPKYPTSESDKILIWYEFQHPNTQSNSNTVWISASEYLIEFEYGRAHHVKSEFEFEYPNDFRLNNTRRVLPKWPIAGAAVPCLQWTASSYGSVWPSERDVRCFCFRGYSVQSGAAQ